MKNQSYESILCPNCGDDLLPWQECPGCGWTPYATMDPMGAIRGVGRASAGSSRQGSGRLARTASWLLTGIFLLIALLNIMGFIPAVLRDTRGARAALREIDPVSLVWILVSFYVVGTFAYSLLETRRTKKGRPFRPPR